MKLIIVVFFIFVHFSLFSQVDYLPNIAYDFLPPVSQWENIVKSSIGTEDFTFKFENKTYIVNLHHKNQRLTNISIYDTLSYTLRRTLFL
jgi:hypothetical protein